MGGAIGGLATGDLGGVAGGALAGSAGVWGARKLLSNKNASGMGAALLERGGYGLTAAASTIGNRKLFDASMKMKGMAGRAAGYLGQNSAMTNKVGGYAFAGLGAMAAGNIGSSVLRSNGGY